VDFDDLARHVPGSELLTEPADTARFGGDWSSLSLLLQMRGAETAPAAVLRVVRAEDAAAALAWATEHGVAVIPAGGRSGVSGGVRARGDELMVDLTRMDRVLDFDSVSGVVHVQAGVIGSTLETWLNERGHTLGHFPQSVALSTVGGWVAARSAGQFSSGYGAIEDMLLGLRIALPDGTEAVSRPSPRSAAGPALHQLFCGSEGTLGVVTEAWLRTRPRPETRRAAALTFSSFAQGLEAARAMAQHRAAPDALRVYDEADVGIAFRGLDVPSGCVMVLVVEGDEAVVDARLRRAIELADAPSPAPAELAEHWLEHRNDAVESYRRVLSGELLGNGAAVDTIEVAGLWSGVQRLYEAVGGALAQTAMVVGCHCSHVYETGCALYFTFLLEAADREAAITQAWSDALDAALGAGGTMTHHHGVGQLKTAWLSRELAGFAPVLGRIQDALDPAHIMNPATLRP
jgi:alkyldihydroxyacetonephosphate synthase